MSDTVSLQSEGPEARTVSSGAETEWEYAPREVFEVRPSAYTTAAFASLDLISARDVFGQRACIMKVHPAFVRGAFRCAMRLALQEINTGMESHDTTKVSRGWELFIFLPRLLLHKPARGGKVPKKKLLERLTQFAEGRWLNLLRESVEVSTEAAQLRHRRRRTGDTVEKRVARAETLNLPTNLGDLQSQETQSPSTFCKIVQSPPSSWTRRCSCRI